MKLQEKFQHPKWNGRYGRSGQNNYPGREGECIKRAVPGAVLPEPEGMPVREAVIKYIPWRRDNVCSHRQNQGGNGVVFAGWHDWNDYAADFHSR